MTEVNLLLVLYEYLFVAIGVQVVLDYFFGYWRVVRTSERACEHIGKVARVAT